MNVFELNTVGTNYDVASFSEYLLAALRSCKIKLKREESPFEAPSMLKSGTEGI